MSCDEEKTSQVLPTFPVEGLHSLSSVLILGRCGTGKTTAMYDVVKHMQPKDGFGHVLGVSSTEERCGTLGGPVVDHNGDLVSKTGLIPPACAHQELDEKLLMDAMYPRLDPRHSGDGTNGHKLVILDHVMQPKATRGLKLLNTLIRDASHCGCGLVCVEQQAIDVKPTWRSCFDTVVCCSLDTFIAMKKVYEVWGAFHFPNFESFRSTWCMMKEEVGPDAAMVMDAHADTAFQYVPPNPCADDYSIPHITPTTSVDSAS